MPRVALMFGLLCLAGCGPVLYMVNLSGAQHAVDEARQSGAPAHAAYEYHYAVEHLRKAQEFASSAEYQDAMDMAAVAEEYGNRARDLARTHAHAPPR